MIKDFIKSNYIGIIFITIVTIIGGGLIALGNYLLTPATNALKNSNTNVFFILLLLMIFTSVTGRVLQFCSGYFFSKQEQRYLHSIRQKTVSRYFKDQNIKKLASMQNRLTNDLKIISDQKLDPLFNILIAIVDLIFSAYVVLTFNFWLLCLIFILAVIMLYIPNLLTKQLEKATNNVSSSYSKYIDSIEKWLAGLAVLQRYHAKKILYSELSRSSSNFERATTNRIKKYTELRSITYGVNIVSQSIVLIITGFLILNRKLTLGTLMSIGNFSSLIFSQLVNITSQVGQIKSSRSLSKEVMADSQNSLEEEDGENIDSLNDFGSLEIENLCIQYQNGEKIQYPNMQIKSGEKILLTGDSGTGKSTLFKMILKELKPTQGEIRFKDKLGRKVNPDTTEIGYIPQDPIIFPGTIEENITMFKDQLKVSASEWSKKVELATDLKKFPQGIKTKVDLDKNNLSGGQRQKIILARTEVYKSKIILIDEGTSAIDSQATQQILRNILEGPETVIFIAHNLTSEMIKLFDRRINLIKR